jgi:acylglycerol lipase
MSATYVETWVPGWDNTNFYTRSYTLPGGATPRAHIVFIHGFIEHIGRYDTIFKRWQANGVSVFGFDQRGFGETALNRQHRTRFSIYGLTSWKQQMEDIAYFINRERQAIGYGVPIILMGQSMGGGEVLGFGSTNPMERSPDHKRAYNQLTAIIASSPIIRQTTPAPQWQLFLGTLASKVIPWFPFTAPIVPEDLCHDPVIQEEFRTDPLVVGHGTVKGISDMLDHGIQLDTTDWKYWGLEFPVLVLHGDQDKVTASQFSQKFVKNIQAKDKTHSLYPGCYHEVHNEPDPVRTKFFEECLAWVQQHTSGPKSVPKAAWA